MPSWSKGAPMIAGTPGLIFRQRLELGLGKHGSRERLDTLASIFSLQMSMMPKEDPPVPDEPAILDLITENQEAITSAYEYDRDTTNEEEIDPDKVKEYDKLLWTIMNRIDQIDYRCKIIENVRESQGQEAPL